VRYDHSVLARVVYLGRLRGGDCDIDRVVSRTVAYAIVTALLAGIYSGLVLLATQVLRFNLRRSHGAGPAYVWVWTSRRD